MSKQWLFKRKQIHRLYPILSPLTCTVVIALILGLSVSVFLHSRWFYYYGVCEKYLHGSRNLSHRVLERCVSFASSSFFLCFYSCVCFIDFLFLVSLSFFFPLSSFPHSVRSCLPPAVCPRVFWECLPGETSCSLSSRQPPSSGPSVSVYCFYGIWVVSRILQAQTML